MATTPFDIIAGPAEVFVAPVAESMPLIDTDPPGGNWVTLGRTEGGITVTHDETIELLRVDQASGPVKAIRPEESLVIAFSLAEIDLEAYARVMNDASVTDNAASSGVAGERSIPLRQGFGVSRFAMLIRGPSPYMDAFLQYEIYIAVQTGSPSLVFVRDDKSVLEVEFNAIEDPSKADTLKFGLLRAQDAAQLP